MEGPERPAFRSLSVSQKKANQLQYKSGMERILCLIMFDVSGDVWLSGWTHRDIDAIPSPITERIPTYLQGHASSSVCSYSLIVESV